MPRVGPLRALYHPTAGAKTLVGLDGERGRRTGVGTIKEVT
jgi:hypothetical protein